MKILLGAAYSDFSSSYGEQPSRALRLNGIYASPAVCSEMLPFELSPMPFGENGFYLEGGEEVKPGASPLHHAGAFYVQEPSAMFPMSSLEIKEDAKILDICASPGGKSIQAAMRAKKGVIVSNEIISSRAATLMGNIERMGIPNAIVTNTDSGALAEWYKGVFDVVICDAPCSGEGMFRKNPTAVSEWSEDNVKMCAARQREILDNAAETVAGGGYLVYSTCTFSLEENEMQIDSFLDRHPGYSLCEISGSLLCHTAPGITFDGCKHTEITRCRRFYPHISRGEGQFAAILRREEGALAAYPLKGCGFDLSRAEEKTVKDFLSDNLTVIPCDRLSIVGKNVCLMPDFPLPPRAVFSAGIKLGGVEKGRLVPHHQVFSALGQTFIRKVELTPAQAAKYISGETVSCNAPDGWTAVTVQGIPLGGGKAVSNVIKNHYPKGLRAR